MAEDRASHSDDRCPGGDRFFEVVRHSHRQFWQNRGSSVRFAQGGELLKRKLRAISAWRDGHQATKVDVLTPGGRFDQFSEISGLASAFALLLAEIDLDQRCASYLGGSSTLFDRLDQAQAIQAVDVVDERKDELDLVPLQSADVMPTNSIEVRHLSGLVDQFLNVILTKITATCRVGLAHRGHGLALRDGHETHGSCRSPRLACR